MNSIICLGTKACDVGEAHEVLSEPLIIKLIDVNVEGENCFSLQPQQTPEEYEKNTPDLSAFFKDVGDEVLFIVSGECEAANCSLKILQQIKHKKINIVYLIPQLDFLTAKQVMQERVIRSVLQEYTRSGLFQSMILLDSLAIENLMGETTIKDFDAQFSVTILALLRNFRNLKLNEPIINNANKPKEISRIVTLGYYDFTNDIERLAFNLKLTDDKIYHFFLSEQTLGSSAKMLREIKDKIKTKAVDNTKVSFTINHGATDFCFVVSYSRAVQT